MKFVLFEPIFKKECDGRCFYKTSSFLKKQQQYVFRSFFLLIKIYWSITCLCYKTAALRGISTISDGSFALIFSDIFNELNVFFSHCTNYLS